MRILVLADDLTGALDTGVKFRQYGLSVSVYIGSLAEHTNDDVDVIDTETRHVSPCEARQIIKELLTQLDLSRYDVIYKKTDSGLRGNIGAELTAVLDTAGGERLYFVPAWPEMERTTRGGRQYLKGIPIEKTEYGRDPFEPVEDSFIPNVIGKQSDVSTFSSEVEIPIENLKRCIVVLDAVTDADMERNVSSIATRRPLLAAGCAGLAGHLARYIGKAETVETVLPFHGIIVLNGSLSEATKRQIMHAKQEGFWQTTIRLDEKESLDEIQHVIKSQGANGVVDLTGTTFVPKAREQTAERIGRNGAALIRALGENYLYFIVGGDTAVKIMTFFECDHIRPIKEMLPGCILASADRRGVRHWFLTKSGSFGEPDIFQQMKRRIENNV